MTRTTSEELVADDDSVTSPNDDVTMTSELRGAFQQRQQPHHVAVDVHSRNEVDKVMTGISESEQEDVGGICCLLVDIVPQTNMGQSFFT